jgi:hypothetical protein
VNTSELKAVRARLLDAIKAIDIALGEESDRKNQKVYDVEPQRLAELVANVESRTRLRDAGAKTSAERLALAQYLKTHGWSVRQTRLDGVRARYWFSPSDPLN